MNVYSIFLISCINPEHLQTPCRLYVGIYVN